jgi:hypothetical protein
MRKTVQTLTLILALACLTYAGDMHTPVAPPPPPPGATGEMLQPLTQMIATIIETTLLFG